MCVGGGGRERARESEGESEGEREEGREREIGFRAYLTATLDAGGPATWGVLCAAIRAH